MGNNKIMVVAPHPDDETLGCGGSLLRHKAQGDEIHWMIATEIEDVSAAKKRSEEIIKVKEAYGFDSVHKLGFPTTKIDEFSVNELISRISPIINKIRPNILYLPFMNDVHSDHKHIFNAVYSCTKIFRYAFIKKIYMMEILSETEFSPGLREEGFTPNVFVNIDKYIDKKIDIMGIYASEIGEHPFPRSEKNIRALGTYRGATSGCDYAESFILIKEIYD